MTKTKIFPIMSKTLIEFCDTIYTIANGENADIVSVSTLIVPGSGFPYQGTLVVTPTKEKKKPLVE